MQPTLRTSSATPKYPKCPDCTSNMFPYSCEGSIIYKCGQCHGLWLTGKKLGIFRNALKRFNFSELEILIHPIDESTYVISSCSRCHQVLEEFEYSYNSGVKVYRCARCQGMWLPLRGMVTLMRSVKIGQSIEDDVRALLIEMNKWHRDRFKLNWFVEVLRALNTRVY